MSKKWCKKHDCPYFNRVEVPYSGSLDADILIVSDSPGTSDLIMQKPLIGPAGQVLQSVLDSIGYSRATVAITTACRCMIAKDTDSITDTNKALKYCRGKLTAMINRVKPKVIITLGAFALKQVLGKQKLMENRGRFFYSDEFNCQVFCTVHPNYVLRGSSREFWNKTASKRTMKENLLFIDFGQVHKFLLENKVDTLDTSKYRKGSDDDAKQILQTASTVAVDFETTGLDLFNPDVKVLCVSICAEEGKPLVFFPDGEGHFSPSVNAILQDPHISKVVAARPFEERICRQKLGFEMQGKVHDVLVMAHLLDENYHSYGLEAVADIYTPLKGIKSLAEGMRGDLEHLDRKKLIAYNAVDADATLRAFNVIRKIMRSDESLLRYYVHMIQKAQDMFADIYFNGCPIDTVQLQKDEADLRQLIEELHEDCIARIPDAIKERHAGKLKLSRPALMQDVLFLHPKGLRLKPDKNYLTPKTKKPQCSEDHLKLFPGHSFIDKYLRMKKAEKVLSTYLTKFWSNIKPDGKVYPSTLFTQTVTGRTVMKEPTIQTIPQRSEFAAAAKRAFVAPEGWSFGARDLGQSEIRIIGWMAQDVNILDALKKEIDIHIKTASIVRGVKISEVTKEMRRAAKGVNFGFIYGMGPWKFKFYAKEQYGVDYTDEESVATRQAFFAYPHGYYKLPEYYKRQEDFVRRYGYVKSPLGRIRRLAGAQSRDEAERREAFRQAVNMPVQSFSSDLGLIGMYLFWKELQKRPNLAKNVRLMWFIHDAIYFQAKDTHFDQAMKLLKHCMEVESKKYVEEKFKVKIGYPITSDGKKGKTWADMKDWTEEEEAA